MAALIEQLVGHKEQERWLLEQAHKKTLPSSLIFQGPEGVGRKYLALALLQVMNCQQSELACGECSHCRRVLEEKNEMVYLLKPESKKSISVDQVREIHSFLTLKSLQPARFVIIDPADKLSTPAANSLLKVLEESPENTYFILITEKMRGLLPTIRSRSHILKFNPLSENELLQYKKFSKLSLQWSAGRLQRAIELEDEKNVEQLNQSLQFFYSLLSGQPQDWKKLAPWFFSNDINREWSIDIWKQALHQRLHQQGENLDWVPEKSGEIAGVYENIESLENDIGANVDKLLALENFFYRLRHLELYQ